MSKNILIAATCVAFCAGAATAQTATPAAAETVSTTTTVGGPTLPTGLVVGGLGGLGTYGGLAIGLGAIAVIGVVVGGGTK